MSEWCGEHDDEGGESGRDVATPQGADDNGPPRASKDSPSVAFESIRGCYPPGTFWRTEWVWDAHAGVDWRDWGLRLSVGWRFRKSYGCDFQFGPVWGYVTREHGRYFYENGERQFGVGEV